MPRFLPLALIIIFIFTGLFLIQGQNARQTESDKLRVVTTFFPLYIFTLNVAGTQADVSVIIPPHLPPHDYSLTPNDLVLLRQADLIIKNGVNFDDWVDRTLETTRPSSGDRIIEISRAPIFSEKAGALEGRNPHIWLSPIQVRGIIEYIRDALIAADNSNAKSYALNAKNYLDKINALDGEIRQTLSLLPNREYLAEEPALYYFSRYYNLRELAVIRENEESALNPQKLIKIKRLLDQSKNKIIFVNRGSSDPMVEVIAGDNGAKVREIDTLETGIVAEDAYEQALRDNLKVFQSVFQ